MIFRTDLALEKQEALEDASPRGVLHAVKDENGVRVTTICIRNEKGEQALGKPKGTYVTLETPTPLSDKMLLSSLRRALSAELCKLLPQSGNMQRADGESAVSFFSFPSYNEKVNIKGRAVC